jgi:hypothetical protein
METHPPTRWVSGNPLVAPGPGIAGRGVIAHARIRKGEWFDCAPVLVLPEGAFAHSSPLNCYVYYWSDDKKARYAMAFGMGSLYNHNRPANVEFELDHKNECVCYRAMRDIEPGEELFIDYAYDEEDLTDHPELEWYKAKFEPMKVPLKTRVRNTDMEAEGALVQE